MAIEVTTVTRRFVGEEVRYHCERGEQSSPGGLMVRDTLVVFDNLTAADALDVLGEWGYGIVSARGMLLLADTCGMAVA